MNDKKRSIKVFISDDHAIIREGLRLLLESCLDIKVVGEAENGRETITNVQKLHPDIVILDIAMPELNGIEATRQIKSKCPNTEILYYRCMLQQSLFIKLFEQVHSVIS